MDEKEYKLPLGICKQAVMKLESFNTDIHEILMEDDLDPEDRETFLQMAELTGVMMANIVNMVSKEMGEEEFINEQIEMDHIDSYPGDDIDLLDMPIE